MGEEELCDGDEEEEGVVADEGTGVGSAWGCWSLRVEWNWLKSWRQRRSGKAV